MSGQTEIARHYSTGSLLERFRAGMAAAGLDPDRPSVEGIDGGDEFHVGGPEATLALLEPLGITRDMHVLDVGAGIGGPARLAAHRYGCRVTGIDLTAEFVATAAALTRAMGMADRVTFVEGSGTDLPLENGSVDLAMMLHVGMNIEDKGTLFREVARVLVPGGRFAVYDIMTGEVPAQLHFPMPWASTPSESFVVPGDAYKSAASDAGLSLQHERSRWEYGRAFMQAMAARAQAEGPPPLGPHLFMGESARERLGNAGQDIAARAIAPVELVFRKPQA